MYEKIENPLYIQFEIGDTPKGKARARTVTKNGRTWSYTPKGTKEFEESIKNAFLSNENVEKVQQYDGPVKVWIRAYFEPPKSLSKVKREDLLNKHSEYLKKPDGDNIAKAVCDALNGVAYKDDCSVYELMVDKYYRESSGLLITIIYDELSAKEVHNA